MTRVCRPGHLARAVELLDQHGGEDVVDQRRLAGAADTPVTATSWPSGKVDRDVAQVVLARADDGELAALGRAAGARPGRRSRGGRRGTAGDRVGAGQQVLDGAGDDDLAAVLAGARADVDDPVGGLDGVLVVLDDDQRVAERLAAAAACR